MKTWLDSINAPEDLGRLTPPELEQLCAELRAFIISNISRTGGHLAANLGVVELTVALLKVFKPPADKLVWDVSHQAYVYKILTGRRDRFCTIRQWDGLSGFLKRDESEYDAFGAGHSGTAISSALGFAAARDQLGGRDNVVAIVGDGSMGCGISLEALNNISETTGRFIVILNDNEMSISENVGAISRHLGRILSSPRYNRWKRRIETSAAKMRMGWLRYPYYRMEEAVKGLFLGSVIFEEFGLRYIGPIDGHSMPALLNAMTIARDSDRPILVHVSTKKGKGYGFAEQQPEKWHGTLSFDVASGEPLSASSAVSYSGVFGATLCRLAAADSRVMAITAAMPSGTGLAGFAAAYPRRFFDVGICEEHAVVFAAGLAAGGMKPVFAVYSTFSQRAVDCIIHDICLQNLPVVICLDRAGIVGDDGPTHHGIYDIALMRAFPHLVMMQPKDEAELAAMLKTAFDLNAPCVIRYPRGAGPGTAVPEDPVAIDVGVAETLVPGEEIEIWALGDMVQPALAVAARLKKEGRTCGVVNARFIKPLDRHLLLEHARRARMIVTMENGAVTGGFGSAIEEVLVDAGYSGRIRRFGWPDEFIPHGAPEILFKRYGLTADAMAEAIQAG